MPYINTHWTDIGRTIGGMTLVLMCSQVMNTLLAYIPPMNEAQRVIRDYAAMVAHLTPIALLMLRLNAYARQRSGMPDGGEITWAWTQLWVHLCAARNEYSYRRRCTVNR
jgi:hypothetical protein